jgi:hypothetical protein
MEVNLPTRRSPDRMFASRRCHCPPAQTREPTDPRGHRPLCEYVPLPHARLFGHPCARRGSLSWQVAARSFGFLRFPFAVLGSCVFPSLCAPLDIRSAVTLIVLIMSTTSGLHELQCDMHVRRRAGPPRRSRQACCAIPGPDSNTPSGPGQAGASGRGCAAAPKVVPTPRGGPATPYPIPQGEPLG